MAKAVTVMLLGKAIEEEYIKNLDKKYSDFYENYKNVEFGKDLTIGDLAKMEAGLDWTETVSYTHLDVYKRQNQMYAIGYSCNDSS